MLFFVVYHRAEVDEKETFVVIVAPANVCPKFKVLK